MPRTAANSQGVEIEYDAFGSPDDPVLLLVMGLGAQLTGWREGFCETLAARGFRVVRFDNRDAGLSTFMDAGPQPDLKAILHGDPSSAPYLLADMALDALSLLDALGVDRAHAVGASMGGMIVQQLAIDHPERVLSLCSIMSRPGDRASGNSTPEAGGVLMRERPADREQAIAAGVAASQVIGSPGYPDDPEELRERVAAALDRQSRSDGFGRQFAAIVASPDRTPGLRGVDLPTLVVHGADDPLIDRSGGEATAKAVPGAELLVIPGMGHSLPEALWAGVADAIAANARRAG
ncbi:alpha/beta fold hydrolase [Streptacidiphilus carbonis]|uniref:alpha/beta fold hydrolase n=1 Tax=Streptacidiphilus carbonis TaxID=105422 RepID=UPI0005AB6640|nr:alpha/beta hydrolase [Streptacidiphilus carbonis]